MHRFTSMQHRHSSALTTQVNEQFEHPHLVHTFKRKPITNPEENLAPVEMLGLKEGYCELGIIVPILKQSTNNKHCTTKVIDAKNMVEIKPAMT